MVPSDLKIVLDDVRARNLALHNLILYNDRQAMDLFRLYVTIAVAGAAAALAGLFRDDELLRFMRWGVGAATIMLAIGAGLCLHAMAQVELGLPGRKAEFWQWALREDVPQEAAVAAYLDQSRAAEEKNYKINSAASDIYRYAKWAGVAAPIIGLVVGAVAVWPILA